MQYDILISPKIEELPGLVNQAFAQGWRPMGSLVVYQHLGQNRFAQPMIRYAKDIPRPDLDAAAQRLGELVIARQGGRV